MADFIDEVIVTEGGACLHYQADHWGAWWTIHAELFEYRAPTLGSAADLRRFLVASLAALDEWEARRG